MPIYFIHGSLVEKRNECKFCWTGFGQPCYLQKLSKQDVDPLWPFALGSSCIPNPRFNRKGRSTTYSTYILLWRHIRPAYHRVYTEYQQNSQGWLNYREICGSQMFSKLGIRQYGFTYLNLRVDLHFLLPPRHHWFGLPSPLHLPNWAICCQLWQKSSWTSYAMTRETYLATWQCLLHD